ncbi:MAG: ATP-binding cassette domain-containing protein [Coriobacteriales bacterium]|jgi:energy-coupling factor transport system ATP-binding protein|nr:ATP-binding cassette domain-containing protein [Coriobacteriales bacterium]
MAFVEVQNLSFSYLGSDEVVVNDISFKLSCGEFVVLCGRSGCGKTTLLRHLKTALAPHGNLRGKVFFDGQPLPEIPLREQAAKIGYVLQNPDSQIVTDKVWHELAFGLESLGVSNELIRLRVAEMASFFGIEEWYHKHVTELSGGQKQILNLAAVMSMQPKLLVLDEPTSMLDPIAAAEFLFAVRKANDELGVTVLLSEHRLEDALPLSDRVLVMSEGRLLAQGTTADVGLRLAALDDAMLLALPTPMRVALLAGAKIEAIEASDKRSINLDSSIKIPVSIREGRQWLSRHLRECQTQKQPTSYLRKGQVQQQMTWHLCENRELDLVSQKMESEKLLSQKKLSQVAKSETQLPQKTDPVISARDIWFRYDKNGVDILRGFSLNVFLGDFLAIIGGNGAGKTTALGTLTGQLKPYRGRLRVAGLDFIKGNAQKASGIGLCALPQDPQTLFLHTSIIQDLLSVMPIELSKDERERKLAWAIEVTEIANIIMRHPYDISGGEMQRSALAMALLAEPKILLLDEPTKGMDAFFKQKFAKILASLLAKDITIIMVSHDIEFCAANASRCVLLFDGVIVADNCSRNFFCGNSFYTTAANRMSRGILDNIVTTEDLLSAIKVREEQDRMLNRSDNLGCL